MGCSESKPEMVDLPAGGGQDAEDEADEQIDNVEEAAQLLDPSNALGSQMEVYSLLLLFYR